MEPILSFLKKDEPAPEKNAQFWKVLSIDDEPDVHTVTKASLKGLEFDHKQIQCLSANTTEEALSILAEHQDIAVILMDVVMETETSGLELIREIRKGMKNTLSRIILRTAHPGYAPEKEVVLEYDINDYKNKSELTFERFFSSMISALRSYRDLLVIQESRRELEESQEQLIQSAKLASLGEMSISIAHELKQPISVMSMLSEIAIDEVRSEESMDKIKDVQTSNWKNLLNHLSKMDQIIKGLQEFGRSSCDTENTEIFVYTLLKKSEKLFHHQFYKHSITVSLDCPDHNLCIFGNEVQIEQVLVNLFSNARDAMESSKNKSLIIQVTRQEKQVVIEVRDTGAGIPEDLRSKVFRSFVSTKEVGKGTGLGLSISRAIMENHNGSLELESEEKVGTSFFMKFPAYDLPPLREKFSVCE